MGILKKRQLTKNTFLVSNSIMKKLSVVIPAKNEAHKLVKCLDTLRRQSIKPDEVIVIDSGSTDGTIELVNKYPEVTLIEIPPSEFNHGGTRNLGVERATGEYVLCTVQDAWGVDDDWIKKLFDGFVDDDIVAVGGSQVVPHEKGANPVAWFRSYSEPKLVVQRFSIEEFERLTPEAKFRACSLDNVNVLYKRDFLLNNPFDRLMEGEDMKWAMDTYKKGYAVAFNQNARVYHYHTEPDTYLYKRSLLVTYLRYSMFGYIPATPEMSFKQMLSILKRIFTAEGLSLNEKISWMKYNRMEYRTIKKAILDYKQLLSDGADGLEDRFRHLVKVGLQRL